MGANIKGITFIRRIAYFAKGYMVVSLPSVVGELFPFKNGDKVRVILIKNEETDVIQRVMKNLKEGKKPLENCDSILDLGDFSDKRSCLIRRSEVEKLIKEWLEKHGEKQEKEADNPTQRGITQTTTTTTARGDTQ